MDATLQKHRRTDVELLRIIAAFLIVYFHGQGIIPAHWAYAGLTVFLIFMGYYACVGRPKSILATAQRLLIPYVVWFVFYFVLRSLLDKPIFREHDNLLTFALSSPSIHLWFLPFAFICISLLHYLRRAVPALLLGSAAVGVATVLILAVPLWKGLGISTPFIQWVHALAPVLIGVGIAQLQTQRPVYRGLALLSVIAALIIATLCGEGRTAIGYALGIALCSVLFARESLIRPNRLVDTVAPTTMGIYLVHPAALVTLYWLGLRADANVVVGFLVSAAGVWLVQKVMPPAVTRLLF
ncbi:acyltransferase family protein [Teredinibacter turnerae]|uniref:acyltransferase family protein n=1 Tax=Teredinibacter turnerae TaxID=2426 RepID=UPI000366CFE6|nr:acyltransferase family protein [Teredinibacter turnerae]